MLYLAVIAFALVGSLLLSRLVLKYFPRLGLMDNPEKYGFKRKPVPYSAGIVLYIIFLLGALVFLDINMKLVGVIIGATLLVVTSFIDDRYDLSPYLRLWIQAVAAVVVVATGTFIYGFNIPFYGWLEFGQFGGQMITALWLMLVINVMNWLDGAPGLASGSSTIGFFTIFALSVLPQIHTLPQQGVTVLTLLLGVASLVVTGFCWPKLRYLIGDTGSMFLGFMLGVVAVYGGGKVATAALVLFVPIFDAFWIVFRRVLKGKSPFKGDLAHLHHRLQRVGISSQKLVFFYLLFMSLIAVVSLLILSTQLKGFMAMILFAILLFVAIILVYLEEKYGSS
ncbi:hypothetical protein COV81_04290 [Candidatus Peregrinibacteria bacterium CG11_big_fil_rev_8_21_14_0_20_41_10]|nr:MAG: hypothetical protein COV81_04290 [Candidatus Peregrinibacteria bacterium CG11_big_fil_rev_8_21_14_0_20_41_10]PIZ74556.1 MAG: hypothetical protein COY06_04075 [Candidatus Peregrinibacteria bacterium CG_4_10_14_0_2_um_filter_41_8]PJC37842.1 MAG: hypothetical protein CO045_03200 [Candidatus Peregrinibacteria bacterium CG_4_9_14_0_2_um_filter_41_14]